MKLVQVSRKRWFFYFILLSYGIGQNACQPNNSLEILGTDPATGGTDGYDLIHIQGFGFVPGATVSFGGTPAVATAFVSDQELDVVTPPRLGIAGRTKITVKNPADQGGDSTSNEQVFSYYFSTLSFATPTLARVGTGATSFVAADLNGDGKIDILTTNSQANTLSVLLGQGDGSFQAPVTVNINTAPEGSRLISLAVGDLNGDQRLDVVVGHSLVDSGSSGSSGSSDSPPGQVSLLLGQNTTSLFGTATALSVASEPQALAMADVNSDARLDLVVAGGNNGLISTYTGNGNGTFTFAQSITMDGTVNTLAVSDIDGDGFMDLLSGNGSAAQVWIGQTQDFTLPKDPMADPNDPPKTEKRATGMFQSGPKIDANSLGNIAALSLGDINQDGQLDIGLLGDVDIAIYLSKGGNLDYALSAFLPQGSAPKALLLKDINGDNAADVEMATVNTASVVASQARGGYHFSPAVSFPNASLSSVAVQDLNNDGKQDLILLDQAQNQVSIFLNTSQ